MKSLFREKREKKRKHDVEKKMIWKTRRRKAKNCKIGLFVMVAVVVFTKWMREISCC